MSTLHRIVDRLPGAKVLVKAVLAPFRGRGVSSDYAEIISDEVVAEAARLRGAWLEPGLPARQRELVEKQLSAHRRGERVEVFEVMLASLRDLGLTNGPASLLEVGCSSGYYSEVILPAPPGFTYAGCDYSPAFVEMARATYPGLRFDVEDAARLSYADAAFDVVVSGCCLLHIPEYRAAVSETARVARTHAIFHRTPVVVGQREKIYRKLAYGVETVEIHFNEAEFHSLLAATGLQLIATHTLSETVSGGVGEAMRTYVCRKVGA